MPGGLGMPVRGKIHLLMDELKVLLFNVPAPLLDRTDGLLTRPPFAVEECAMAEELHQRLEKIRYKMVILNLPSAGLEPRDILYTLRHLKKASSEAIIIILAPEDHILEYKAYLTKGLSALLSHTAPPREIEIQIARLAQVSPRVESRIMVRLKAKLQQHQHGVVLAQALNLSITGLFVATSMKFPVGCEVLFELLLPQSRVPISGEAKVVRHSTGSRDRSDGMGLTFTSFKADGKNALKAFIDQKLPPLAPRT